MSVDSRVIIGTRGSALARAQTDLVKGLLLDRYPGLDVQVLVVETRGDRIQDRPISAIGDKGVFVRAIERALLGGEIDLAVHSLKDVPADAEMDGLVLAAFSSREDPRDALVTPHGESLADLPPGARVGTSSARRRLQLRALRPDLEFRDIRGNVDTRLRKLDAGEYDALVLAAAGLIRLGLGDRISQYLDVDLCVPDAGQGVMAVQARAESQAAALAAAIDNPSTRICVRAERAVVRGMDADCHSPVGAYATVDGDRVTLRAVGGSDDGTRVARRQGVAPPADAEEFGFRIGQEMLQELEG